MRTTTRNPKQPKGHRVIWFLAPLFAYSLLLSQKQLISQQLESTPPTEVSLTAASTGEPTSSISHLTFLATFDIGLDADFSRGDKRIHTAEDLNRKVSSPGNSIDTVEIAQGQGRYGNALRFGKKTQESLFYSAKEIGYRSEDWSGTLSVWMKLDPDSDLLPGYCDPILLSDKQWDQSALFVDFDRELPRDFRLGVFPDYKVWNPHATPWDKIAVADRPMVVAKKPPFSADKWTHVCFTWENCNVGDDRSGKATLYLDGKVQGTHSRVMRYTWDVDKAALMLGIYYIGLMDELAVFDRALSESQILQLANLQDGLAAQLTEPK